MTASATRFDASFLTGETVEDTRARLELIARLLDSVVRIPGINVRIGADAVLNIIPGLGVLTSKCISAYLVWEARRLGVPTWLLLKMAGNIGIDFLIGVVPVVGWVGDVFYRANLKNMTLLREHLDRHHPRGSGRGPVIDGHAEPV